MLCIGTLRQEKQNFSKLWSPLLSICGSRLLLLEGYENPQIKIVEALVEMEGAKPSLCCPQSNWT